MIERLRKGLPDCKPVSVPAPYKADGGHSSRPGIASTAQATYPEVITERAAPPPLFGLAPHGVCPASRIAAAAVRSYRTFSPLPARKRPLITLDEHQKPSPAGGIVFCGTFRKTRLSEFPRPLAGMLPYGDRTFLPNAFPKEAPGRPPVRQAHRYYNRETTLANGVSTISWCIL
jgi:hypothetical protein